MKNVDPRIATGVLVTIIVLCLFAVIRTIGFGGKPTPPPIAGGGPGTSTSMTLPAAPVSHTPGMSPGGMTAPTPGGSMILPTPSSP